MNPGVPRHLVDGPHSPLTLDYYVVANLVEAFPLQSIVNRLRQACQRVLIRADDGLAERLLAVVLKLLLQCGLPVAELGPDGDGDNLQPLVDDEQPIVLAILEKDLLEVVFDDPLARLAEVYQLTNLINLLLSRLD